MHFLPSYNGLFLRSKYFLWNFFHFQPVFIPVHIYGIFSFVIVCSPRNNWLFSFLNYGINAWQEECWIPRSEESRARRYESFLERTVKIRLTGKVEEHVACSLLISDTSNVAIMRLWLWICRELREFCRTNDQLLQVSLSDSWCRKCWTWRLYIKYEHVMPAKERTNWRKSGCSTI
jgi:hypothetical protein